jgi:hypothetical protein
MYVVRLPDGRLRVPTSALARGRGGLVGKDAGGAVGRETPVGRERVIGHAYVEIGPDDPDYQRLLERSITESEMAERRRRWRADDDELRREFEEFKTRLAEE